MDHRLELERRGRDPTKVKELTLDNCRPPAGNVNGISEKLADFVNLEALRMINTGLTTLKGFPKLPQLKKLDIGDNRLTGGLNHVAEACPNLQSLNMGGNRIKDLDTLEPLKQLKNLRHLDMFNCDIVATEDYRNQVFGYLPQLHDLDSFDRENIEVYDSEEDVDEDLEDDEGEENDNDSDEENGETANGDDENENDNENDMESSGSDASDDEVELDENGIAAPKDGNGQLRPPKFPFEGAEYDEEESSEGEDDDEGNDDEEEPLEAVAGQQTKGVKRPHSDDEGEGDEEEDHAEDAEAQVEP